MGGWYARLSYERKEEIAGYLFILPWLVGFVIFQLGAMVVCQATYYSHRPGAA